jgi:hypothetical protein
MSDPTICNEEPGCNKEFYKKSNTYREKYMFSINKK